MPKVDIIISAINKASPELKQVNDDLKKMGETTSRSAAATEMLAGAAASAGVAVLALGAAAGALFLNATQLNARFVTLGVVVDRLGKNVGTSEYSLRALEQQMSKTGISMIGARDSIAQLIGANIDLAHATDLARVAQDAAVIAGIDSTAAFGQLVNFIQTGNTIISRQLGLYINLKTAYEGWADANGRAVASLTENEKANIRVNAVLAEGVTLQGSYVTAMGTADKTMKSMVRQVQDLKVIVGDAAQDEFAWLVAAVYDAADALTASGRATLLMQQAVEDGIYTEEQYNAIMKLRAAGMIESKVLIEQLTTLYDAMGAAEDAATASTKAFSDAVEAQNSRLQTLAATPTLISVSYDLQGANIFDQVQEQIGLLERGAGELGLVTQVLPEVDWGQVDPRIRDMILGQGEALAMIVEADIQGLTPEASETLKASIIEATGIPPEELDIMWNAYRDRGIFAVNEWVTSTLGLLKGTLTPAMQAVVEPLLSSTGRFTRSLDALDGRRIRIYADFISAVAGAMSGNAAGGPLGPITEVGEEGTEGIINGIVIPHGMWERMKDLGLLPSKHMATGGTMIGSEDFGGAGAPPRKSSTESKDFGGSGTSAAEVFGGSSSTAGVVAAVAAAVAPEVQTATSVAVQQAVAAASAQMETLTVQLENKFSRLQATAAETNAKLEQLIGAVLTRASDTGVATALQKADFRG